MQDKIYWLIPLNSDLGVPPSSSNLASIRLRSAVCINALKVASLSVGYGESIPLGVRKIIIGKIGAHDISNRTASWLNQISRAKDAGAKIFLDYTDHHLGFESPMRDFYRKVLPLVDHCISSSEYISFLLQEQFSGPITVIEDAVEITSIKPKEYLCTQPTTALWFGHSTNIHYLIDFINSSQFLLNGNNLIVLSNEAGLDIFNETTLRINSPAQIKLGLWSPDVMLQAAMVSDFCIIPSNLSDSRKLGVSSNRLITAFALGLPTAADHLPSYQKYSDYYVDIRSSKFFHLAENPLLFNQVTNAQSKLLKKYSFEKIGSDWLTLLKG